MDKAAGYEMIWGNCSDIFDRGRGIKDVTFVYFIGERDGGCLKIGKAVDPIARLRGMQTGNPRRLVLEQVLFGDISVEKLFHELWEPFAIPSERNKGKVNERGAGTEWFRPEVREKLFPVVSVASQFQLDVLESPAESGMIEINDLERAVWDAHLYLGEVKNAHDETVFLAGGAGYNFQHRSRVQAWIRDAA